MRRALVSLLCLLLVPAAGGLPAHARSDSFAVGVTVVSGRTDPALFEAVPLPQPLQVMTIGRYGRHHRYSGALDQAAAFFNAEMPRRGYRLLQLHEATGAQEQLWEDGRSRVLLRLRQALGTPAATRISVQASALPASHASSHGAGARARISPAIASPASSQPPSWSTASTPST